VGENIWPCGKPRFDRGRKRLSAPRFPWPSLYELQRRGEGVVDCGCFSLSQNCYVCCTCRVVVCMHRSTSGRIEENVAKRRIMLNGCFISLQFTTYRFPSYPFTLSSATTLLCAHPTEYFALSRLPTHIPPLPSIAAPLLHVKHNTLPQLAG